MERERLEEALELLGALLDERHESAGLLVVGGSSLLLLGVVDRPTADVDVAGFPSPAGYIKADALPAQLVSAIRDVADTLELSSNWCNNGPASLLDFGLPPGFADRVTVRRFGALDVHLPARADLVCFKLFAAVDQGERSKHFMDLLALAPTAEDLITAARWTRTQDPSPGYLGELKRMLRLLTVEADDAALEVADA